MGDPQAPFERVLAVLGAHLGGDGHLRPDVRLLSIGDHFDYRSEDARSAGQHGLRTVEWLAGHAPEQVTLIFGNHDAVRVMELASLTDADFARARQLARSRSDALWREFPTLPTAELVLRDFACFSAAQRALVQRLLLARRFRMAAPAALEDGTPVLITHAGVTRRDLEALGIGSARDPHAIARALNAWLDRHVDQVRQDWERGRPAALPLGSPHCQSRPGEAEAGGPLYHRPSDPAAYVARAEDERERCLRERAFDDDVRRRFHPRELPEGLVQVCGHTQDKRCVQVLAPWARGRTRAAPGRIRSLTVASGAISYTLGVAPRGPGDAQLIMIDGHMLDSDDFELLPLGSLQAS